MSDKNRVLKSAASGCLHVESNAGPDDEDADDSADEVEAVNGEPPKDRVVIDLYVYMTSSQRTDTII
jgi:hypothetical protein